MLERLRRGREEGFTLIELLVVVIIIGILAAIAIPAFLGQQDKAEDAGAKSAVRNAASAMEAHYTDGRTYVVTEAALEAIEPSIDFISAGIPDSTAAKPQVLFSSTATTYSLSSKAGSNATTYTLAKAADGTVSRTKTGGGTW
jgi:type IV pilus assembly protein PilA